MVEYKPLELQRSARLIYTTNACIADYKRPYISIIDGVTMGAGAGLSIHGKYRIATERTTFAMPEVAVGLTPDVGASHFLPRLEGKLGLFLGLTGFRLKGYDVLSAGLATHYVLSQRIPDLERELLASDGGNIEEILLKYSSSERRRALSVDLATINKCFSAERVEDIIKSLEVNSSEFAQSTLKTLLKMPPTSLKTTKRSFDQGKDLSLKECLKVEMRLITRHIFNGDFKEAVRAFFVEKDQKPKWSPGTLEEVTDQYVDSFFAEFPKEHDELRF